MLMSETILVFFFQAEDGIRDDLVTGVQTCALPISLCARDRATVRRDRPRARARSGTRQRRRPRFDGPRHLCGVARDATAAARGRAGAADALPRRDGRAPRVLDPLRLERALMAADALLVPLIVALACLLPIGRLARPLAVLSGLIVAGSAAASAWFGVGGGVDTYVWASPIGAQLAIGADGFATVLVVLAGIRFALCAASSGGER